MESDPGSASSGIESPRNKAALNLLTSEVLLPLAIRSIVCALSSCIITYRITIVNTSAKKLPVFNYLWLYRRDVKPKCGNSSAGFSLRDGLSPAEQRLKPLRQVRQDNLAELPPLRQILTR